MSDAGDVNGDGIADVVVGARFASPVGAAYAGESYVVFGSTQGFPAILPLESLFPDGGGDGSRGFVLTGADAADHSGVSVSAAGDVNGDGVDDLIISASGADPYGSSSAGESYIVFGSTRAFPPVVPLASLYPDGGGDGTHGFVLAGIRSFDVSGYSVSGAGDVNGDGVDDLVIGAWSAKPYGVPGAGESYVFFGSSQGFPATIALASLYPAGGGDGSRGFVLTGFEPHLYSGKFVSGAGDINGDGIDDVVIAVEWASPLGKTNAGASYVVLGSTLAFPPVIPLDSLHPGGDNSSRGFVLTGAEEGDFSGYTVSAAGDVNGDGIDDLIIGARHNTFFGGVAGADFVVFGSTQGFPPIVPLGMLYPQGGGDGTRGFVLSGIDSGDFADTVSAAGDVNGDGIDDLIIGAYRADPGGKGEAGESYVVFGRATAP